MKAIKDKKGTVYDWLDIVVPFTVIFFIFLFMFALSSTNKDIVDNEITEMNDGITGNQELVNFLRIRLSDVVPDIESFPEETRDMTFGEFFIWYDYIKANDLDFDNKNLDNLDKGLEAVFEPHYKEWNFYLKYEVPFEPGFLNRYDHGNCLGAEEPYYLQLPSYTGNYLTAYLFLTK